MGGVNFEGVPGFLHNFRRSPERVVWSLLSNMAPELIGGRMSLDKIVVGHLEVIEEILELSALLIGLPVIDGTPGEHRRGRSHGKPELYMVTRVEPAAGQIDPHVRTIGSGRVAFPRHTAQGRLAA